MKKQLITLVLTYFFINAGHAQIPPTAGNSNPNNVPAWSRAGNNQGNGGNVFGTRYNSPVYFITGSNTAGNNGGIPDFRRMKLNGVFGVPNTPQYFINGYGAGQGVNSTGYLLLGQNMNSASGNIYTDLGAFSMLHLNGRDQPGVQEAGYRPWMKTGVTFTDNNDLSYMGVRKLGTGTDRTETVIAWSDNASTGLLGPDDMVFRYTSGGQGNVAISNDLTTANDLDGRHIARFAPTGEFGLGNTFGVNVGGPAIYVRPQSLLHLSRNDGTSVWTQYTNEVSGQTANNGLRVGLLGRNNPQRNGNALVYQQDNRHLLFSTNAATDNVGPVNTRERMRITSVSAPTALSGGGYGVHNPGNIAANRTRVAISHNPANPVSRPLSLLHLGYNTGSALLPGTLDGWRPWMDVGMFVAQGTDNMYFGLKDEGNDRFDAIINWGDNQDVAGPFPVGPDNLRFVFTSTTAFGSGDPVSTSDDGLEIMRMEPQDGQTFQYNDFGMVGIGNFAANGPNTAPADVVDAKLDIDGDLRIRQVIQDDLLERVLVVDPTDLNRVYWRDINSIVPNANVQANNGTSLDPNSIDPIIQLGQELTGGVLAFNGIGELLNDREIPMNGQDLIFSSTNNGFTQPGIERIAIGATLPSAPGTPVFPSLPTSFFNNASSKLQVFNATEQTGAHFLTFMDPLNVGFAPDQYSGAKGTVFATENDKSIIGLLGQGISLTQGTRTEGVRGESFGAGNNVGVSGRSIVTPFTSTGGEFTSRSVDGICLPGNSVGVRARATGSNTSNIAVFGEVDNGNPCNAAENFAGWFNGDVFVNGNITSASDENLKTNIQPIQGSDALTIIQNLNPVSFEYDNSINQRMMLPDGLQYGFVAQDVVQVLPAIVHNSTLPAEHDSLGNEVSPAFQFLSIETQDLIPLLFAGMQEQNNLVDSLSNELAQKDSLINDVNDRLTQLENCLSNLLPLLCQINNSAIYENNEESQNELIHTLNLELHDGENIILEQNIPNPFAERTVINYYLPESVRDAKIIFYNQEGRMINEMNISERGNGQLNVYGADLSKGIYSYTLICDGQVIATKKMVKQ